MPGIERDEVDFLSLLSEANRTRFLDGSTTAVHPPGTRIFHPEGREHAYVLVKGLARAYAAVPDGRQATVTFIHSRELVGGTLILGRWPLVTVQVVVKATLITLDLHNVRRLAGVENEVTMAIAIHLAARVRGAFKLIAVRSLGDIRQRLSYDLLDRACRSQLAVGRLEARVTHADLADSIGSAREVVGRAIATLRDEGIVETAPGVVRVLNPLRLAGIVRAFTI